METFFFTLTMLEIVPNKIMTSELSLWEPSSYRNLVCE